MISKIKDIKCKDVKAVMFHNTKASELYRPLFAESKINIHYYLPEYEHNKDTNRVWLWNVGNSLIPAEFKVYIKKKVIEQNWVESKNLWLTVKPKFLNLFKNSQSVSMSKGNSHFLARLSRKTKNQIKID